MSHVVGLFAKAKPDPILNVKLLINGGGYIGVPL